MASELSPIDITTIPELAHLAEEVARTRHPRVLRRGGEDIAVLMPTTAGKRPRPRRTRSQAGQDPFLTAAGSWEGLLDPEQFKQDLREARGSDRPPVIL